MKTAGKRELLGEFRLTPEGRTQNGHLVTWTQAAKDAVSLYLSAIERDPTATITLTLEKS